MEEALDNKTEYKKSRVGKSLGSSRFEEESRIYLQRRLRLLTTVVAILFLLLSVSFIISLANEPSRSFLQALVIFCTKFPNAVLFFLSASSSLIALVLWRKRVSVTVLSIVEALFLQVLVGLRPPWEICVTDKLAGLAQKNSNQCHQNE